jgi:hypothetical protein
MKKIIPIDILNNLYEFRCSRTLYTYGMRIQRNYYKVSHCIISGPVKILSRVGGYT